MPTFVALARLLSNLVRHDRPGRCRWHSPVFLWCVDKNSKSLRFQRVSDHWALVGSTSAARVLHSRLWGLELRTFASMDLSFITPQIVLVVLVTLVLLVAALVLVTLSLRSD